MLCVVKRIEDRKRVYFIIIACGLCCFCSSTDVSLKLFGLLTFFFCHSHYHNMNKYNFRVEYLSFLNIREWCNRMKAREKSFSSKYRWKKDFIMSHLLVVYRISLSNYIIRQTFDLHDSHIKKTHFGLFFLMVEIRARLPMVSI